MNIKDKVISLSKKRKSFSTNDVLNELGKKYTRAYVGRFINELIREGKLSKSGSTRSALYASSEKARFLSNVFEKRYKNKELKEHEILAEFRKALPSIENLPEHIKSIFNYAFSEMVNNAIDHSSAPYIDVRVEKTAHILRFFVRDSGIGVFRNVMKDRKLISELEAMQDLLKGKTTTMPNAHSGEGIFFTSKVADVFILDSFEYQLKIDNKINDIFFSELHSQKKKGTNVTFEIDDRHNGHLSDVFTTYYTDPSELAFDKTEIQVKLYAMGSIYISRSQARRILQGLDKFKTVILDFDKVPGVGQSFADEIFRVFHNKHPDIIITPVNMNEAVRFMVGRVAM